MRTMYCSIGTLHGQVPSGAPVAVSIHMDGPPEPTFTAAVKEPGRLFVQFSDDTQQGHGGEMTVTLDGATWTGRFVTPIDHDVEGPNILLVGQVVPHPISIAGRDFITPDGQRWTWKGATDFALLLKFLNGDDLSAVTAQRVAAGANLARVLGMAQYMWRFHPQDYGEAFYGALVPFAQKLAHDGLFLELTVFADAQEVMPNQSQQQAHWARVCDTLRGQPNVFLELVNEWPKNGVDPRHFQKPDGILCSQGSDLGDTAPPSPGWDYHTWHGRRDWPKVNFSNEDMWYVAEGIDSNGHRHAPPKPAVSDEPIGFANYDQDGKRSTSQTLARTLGLSAIAFGNGGTFHTESGLTSSLWNDIEWGCALVYFKALTEE